MKTLFSSLTKGAGFFELQPEFYKKGSSHIRPMTMKQIAERLYVHDSTVSRTVNNGKLYSVQQFP
ncbi:hypothetical protein [Paenibacillus sp. V4I9]|uniref:RNA polymerase factor sigma-54 n=1 Tax=Paenibacillus sp. V4I9 TaxID=3042308 RepID=UPI0027D841E1|nr:hypothetical protein [Paenibacillus sp. V4I9]